MAYEPQQGDLVTVRQAANILCVNYDTVLVWLRKGVFPRVVRVGPAHSLRLYREDVLQQRHEQAS